MIDTDDLLPEELESLADALECQDVDRVQHEEL